MSGVKVVAVLAMLLAGIGSAWAQADNPIGGAAENFFTLSPETGSLPPAAFGGAACNRIVPSVGAANVVWGRFSGGRVYDGAGSKVRMRNFTSDGCFPSLAACEAWMYQLKSRYQDNPRYNDCSPGYQPGRPVRWVFGPPR